MGPSYQWWHKAVIYQIYPRSFSDSNGNGVGDLQGIQKKLDYLADVLGIDAIWISPFYPSPMKDFGYDVADYCGVDPLFGTMAGFDDLLRSAHQRDIRIIIDLVPNHTSDQHPWFVESRSSRQNPKRDWYVWKDAQEDGSPPNNWLSMFGGSAWEWDQTTGQYYLHSFLEEQPDLNWRNPEVQHGVFEAVRFWLEKGVDGFRIDVAHFIMKDPELRDNPLNPDFDPSFHKSMGEYDSQIHLYDKGHPDVHQVYQDFRKLLDQYSENQARVSLGEIHIFNWVEWIKYFGKDQDELHLPINFSLMGVPWHPDSIRKLVEGLEENLPIGAWPNYVLANHDDPRIASRVGQKQARNAALLLLSLRGTPVLYYGDEIGMLDQDIPPELEIDPSGLRQPGQGRDAYRTPMQWSAAEWAGFSPPIAQSTWLPVAEDFQERNVEQQLEDPGSILNFYRQLLQLRKTYTTLQTGDYQAVPQAPEGCYLYLRADDQAKILVALNFTDEVIQFDPDLVEGGKLLISSDPSREPGKSLSDLDPNEGILVNI